jgi:hypothetical protein
MKLELESIREKKVSVCIMTKDDQGSLHSLNVDRMQADDGELYLTLPNFSTSASIYLCELLAMLRLLGYGVVLMPKEQPKRGRGRPKGSLKRMVRK